MIAFRVDAPAVPDPRPADWLGWRCWLDPPHRRMPNCSSCATRSRCCGERPRSLAWTGPIGHCSPACAASSLRQSAVHRLVTPGTILRWQGRHGSVIGGGCARSSRYGGRSRRGRSQSRHLPELIIARAGAVSSRRRHQRSGGGGLYSGGGPLVCWMRSHDNSATIRPSTSTTYQP
jgi:hypothetical protein